MAQPDRARRPATYDDLLKVPNILVAEILDGELYVTPRPAPKHADAGSGLGGALRGPFDRGRGGPGGWRILFESELHLKADVLVPDLAGWRRSRLPVLPDEAFFSIAPDWTCEVVSPSTAALDRVKNLSVYTCFPFPHSGIEAEIVRPTAMDPVKACVCRIEHIVALRRDDDRRYAEWRAGQRIQRTTPATPSTATCAPSGIRLVASPTPSTIGMPRSRASDAKCEVLPPRSVTTPATRDRM